MSHSNIRIAKKYISKNQSSNSRGIGFDLSFCQYKKLLSRKTCAYTGIKFPLSDSSGNIPTSRTLERIDHTLGYTVENTVAVCLCVNQLKSMWEDPSNPLTFAVVQKMVMKLHQLY